MRGELPTHGDASFARLGAGDNPRSNRAQGWDRRSAVGVCSAQRGGPRCSSWESATDFLAFEFELAEPIGPIDRIDDLRQNLVGDFRIFAGGEIIYRDADFPVLVLAEALASWLERVERTHESFVFDGATRTGSGTINAVLPALFRILRGSQGWGLTSIQLDLASTAVFTLDQVMAAAASFVVRVDAAVEAL